MNYHARPERATALNLLVARVLLVLYAAWKLVSYEWSAVADWPWSVFQAHPHAFLLPAQWMLDWIWVEVALCLVLLALVLAGAWMRWTPLATAFVLAHLTGVHLMVTNSGNTFLPPIYLLLLWGLYRVQDAVTVDAVRATASDTVQDLNRRLAAPPADRPARRHDALGLFLVVVAVTYFFTGYAKIVDAGTAWLDGDHLARIIQYDVQMHMDEAPPLAAWLLAHPAALAVAAVGTVVLELALLPLVLLRRDPTLVVLGLLGMHAAIALAQEIFFFDQYILFALLLPWDRFAARLQPATTLTVLYDTDCHFCARSLVPFLDLDAAGRVRFVGTDERPPELAAHDLDLAMAATDGTHVHVGYHGFAALCHHTGLLRPVAWVMSWPFVARRGERAYAWVAANRHRISTCKIQ